MHLLDYFDINRRAPRNNYWNIQKRLIGLCIVLYFVSFFVMMAAGYYGYPLVLVLGLTYFAALCNGIRRAHDRNRGILWFLLVTLGPFPIGYAGVSIYDAQPWGQALCITAAALKSWGCVEMGLMDGHPSHNRYGAPTPA
ncbi:DUF805 domain-containing protein [Caulobacter sp.]|uniref:DUF805 domain-containing protein n=1 Tax=Caulobacter sp. TaxID=78 RepID=UPI001B223004|nr:DUF805 domain-containing protein [Caulobacter sp.]MBO9545081.1 DUF805 domain-containing protein [Caulobacter sp.]